MDKNYTFDKFIDELNNGFQIKYTYVNNKYVIFKTTDNCYTQKLLSVHSKNPQPIMSMLTLRRVKEIFPFFEDVEYIANKDE